MNNKYTFWTLCNLYDKIEVPIIQRDYAQGRDTPEVERIRKSFINDYLLDSLLKGTPRELDFVYGSTLEAEDCIGRKTVFIPLDGQQRLTTLFLLHWFIAVKEHKLQEAKQTLLKFTYETRPSAHDFCGKLLEIKSINKLKNIKREILDSSWYDDEWSNDPTIRGMLTMLDTFAKNKALLEAGDGLFDSLIRTENPILSFYFIPLEQFGLTENLYIRMNARGKMLSPFENFKSEFYKIIAYDASLQEQVKDKIEYLWVEHLWEYREDKKYVIDKPFMQYLEYISRMLYFKDANYRSENYENDFLDFRVLTNIYAKTENIKFLIFALDNIPLLTSYRELDILWSQQTSICDIFKLTLTRIPDILNSLLLYATLCYFFKGNSQENFLDFIRVIRNLVENTADKSIREWPRLLESINKLATKTNIYEVLSQPKANELMDGFYVPQRKEEIFKAQILKALPDTKAILFLAEENPYLKGNINALIASNFVKSTDGLKDFDSDTCDPATFNISLFSSVFGSYKAISKDNFKHVWGDLIHSSLYSQYAWSRLIYDDNHSKNPAVIALAMDYRQWPEQLSLDDFLRHKERSFINKLIENDSQLAEIRDVKSQLYLYYILHRRITKKNYQSFFSNGYNFGWLEKTAGFVSAFTKGIANDHWYEAVNPIFQTYQSQFRYSLGLKDQNAIPAEVVGSGRKQNPFKLLIEWAAEKE